MLKQRQAPAPKEGCYLMTENIRIVLDLISMIICWKKIFETTILLVVYILYKRLWGTMLMSFCLVAAVHSCTCIFLFLSPRRSHLTHKLPAPLRCQPLYSLKHQSNKQNYM